jgi:hypothetical protein
MLLHGLNNLLAVVMSKVPQAENLPGSDDTTGLSLQLFAASAVCLTAVGMVVWTTRVQYRLPDGSVWDPGYPTVEPPPAELGAVPRRTHTDVRLIAAAACTAVIFAGLLAYDVWKDVGV